MTIDTLFKRHARRLLLTSAITLACASTAHAQNQPWKVPLSNNEMALLVDFLTRIGVACIKADPDCARGLGSEKLVPNYGQRPPAWPRALWPEGVSGYTEFVAGVGLSFCDLNPEQCRFLADAGKFPLKRPAAIPR